LFGITKTHTDHESETTPNNTKQQTEITEQEEVKKSKEQAQKQTHAWGLLAQSSITKYCTVP
jgi:hypothetical protein